MTPMNSDKLVEQTVTYTLLKDDQLYVVEHVPARVDPETGEQFFAPDTVERLQKIIPLDMQTNRTLHTAVYEFAAGEPWL